MERSIVSVIVFGQEYKIIANSQEEEIHIEKAAKLVQEELEEISRKTGASQVAALVYTAMNISDLYFKEQENMKNLRFQITESADRISKLEKELTRLKQDKPKVKPKTERAKVTKTSAKETEQALEKVIEELLEQKDEPAKPATPETKQATGKPPELAQELAQELAEKTAQIAKEAGLVPQEPEELKESEKPEEAEEETEEITMDSFENSQTDKTKQTKIPDC